MPKRVYTEAQKQHNRDYAKSYYHMCKDMGICPRCKTRPAAEGMVACPECLYRGVQQRIEAGEAGRAWRRAYMQAWRAEHKAEGICTECKQPAAPGHRYCERHRLIKRQQQARAKVYAMRDTNKCLYKGCEAPLVPGKHYCEAHYQIRVELAFRNLPNSRKGHIWAKLDHADVMRVRQRSGSK